MDTPARIASGLCTEYPVCAAEAPDGVLYFATGNDRVLRWDGTTEKTEWAGIEASTSACTMAASTSTSGTIYGDYTAYVRFLDDEDIPSSFSAAATLSITSGAPAPGISYSAIPVSSTSRCTKREVWRNTAGQNVTWYLDCTIADNTTTTTSSTRTDGELVTQSSIRFVTEDGWPNAMRFTPPPNNMGVVVSFQDRMWYAVPRPYTAGHAIGSGTAVSVWGGDLRAQMAGRRFYQGAHNWATIGEATGSSVTLVAEPASGFGPDDYYAIYDADVRNTIYFSEAGEPESVPTSNAITLQEDGDKISGLMPLYSFLFILKERHIYRMASAGDPRRDATVSLVAERGCVNQRCWCRVEGTAFLMDETGIYVFKDNETQAVSSPIQDVFRGQINWDHRKWFHCVHSADEETVRFFVSMDTDLYPTHALCFNYRLQQWHTEQYPFDIGASCNCRIGQEYRTLVGSDESVSLLGEGVLDGCALEAAAREDSITCSQTLRGTVTAASSDTITDSAASWNFSDWHVHPVTIGAPVYIIASDGSVQWRRISAINYSTKILTVVRDWDTTPSVGDTYMIGGINWQAKFGAFAFLEEESQNVRQIKLRYQPQADAATLEMRTYLNHSATEQSAHVAWNNGAGVSVAAGSGNLMVDLTGDTGYARWNLNDGFENHGPADRTLEVELEGVSGKQKTQIYALDIDGVDR